MASQETQQWRPRATHKDLLIQDAGDEVLVYNLKRHYAHCLNATAVRLWRLCTGRLTVAQIASALKISMDPVSNEVVVRKTIIKFERLGLVEPMGGAAADMSRRKMVRRIGAVAAGITLPLITSIVAPTPAYGASCGSLGALCGAGRPACCAGLSCQDMNGILICQ